MLTVIAVQFIIFIMTESVQRQVTFNCIINCVNSQSCFVLTVLKLHIWQQTLNTVMKWIMFHSWVKQNSNREKRAKNKFNNIKL